MAQAPLQITLSDETAIEFVRSKVQSGAYASETDVVQEGIEALRQLTEEREQREREILIPACERLMANPASAIPIEQVERNLAARRQQRSNSK
jgi:antitoxin ParD1/3/4